MAFSVTVDDFYGIAPSFFPENEEFKDHLVDHSAAALSLFAAPDLDADDVFVAAKEAGVLGKPFLLAVVFAGKAAGGFGAVLLVVFVAVVGDEFAFAVQAGFLFRLEYVHAVSSGTKEFNR